MTTILLVLLVLFLLGGGGWGYSHHVPRAENSYVIAGSGLGPRDRIKRPENRRQNSNVLRVG